MTKIAATEERTLTVPAPIQEVYRFFSDPVLLREATVDVERFERIDEHRARWVLTEKVEKGVRFLADYTVEYQGNGSDRVSWRSVAGNLDVTGEAELRPLPVGGTEIHYRETVAPDLPIASLMAKLFKPIVARELRQDIGRFLTRVAQRLGAS